MTLDPAAGLEKRNGRRDYFIKLPRQKRGETRRQLVSISDVAGLVRAEYGLSDEASDAASDDPIRPQRVLELSLPVSPFHGGSFGKVSFVENDRQYIHTFLPPAAAGNELSRKPASSGDEWFTVAGTPAAAGEPCSPPPALHSRYQKMLAGYILRLKALKKNRGRLDPELLEKLKALGYLND